jgi:small subunit ribosomal protein S12
MTTLHQLALFPRIKKKRKSTTPGLAGSPQRKGVCLKIYTTTPRKPNSAIRKVAKLKVTATGKKLIAYIPGQGHSLQEHSVVLVRGGRVPDLPGMHYKLVRGHHDFLFVERFDRSNKRSKFSIPKKK